MKKLFLIMLAVLSCSAISAGVPEKIELLSSKAILANTEGYYVLSDGSCWKVIGFSRRWRSFNEWWNGVQLVPKNYECVPNDWFLATEIEVYPKFENLQVNEADASNEEALKQCTHLLANSRTGQVLFAIALHPADCMVQVFNDAHADGYNKGYEKGRLDFYQNGADIYKSGHSEGYKAGYAEGLKAYVEGH